MTTRSADVITVPSGSDTELDVARAFRDHAVRLGWAQVEAAERVEVEVAKRQLRVQLRAQAEHAKATVPPLKPWSACPPRVMQVMNNPPNQFRIRRVLDLVRNGDRILDIGVGYGYLAGVLQRDGQVGPYTGIDLAEHLLESAEQMRAVNGLTGVPCNFQVKNLFDLTPEWVAEVDPDLVVLLEVLEHVKDAELGLATVGRCLRPDAAVVFSVPVLGRVEFCWGHLSLFSADRVRAMVAAAGLFVQHVEVVYDTWMLVVASPGDAVLPRVVQIASRPVPAPAPSPAAVPAFVPAKLSAAGKSKWAQRSESVEVHQDKDGLHCMIKGSRDTSGGQYGGVRIPIAGDLGLRFELVSAKPKGIRKLYVDFSDAKGHRVCRWVWTCSGDSRPTKSAATHVLHAGRAAGPFRPSGTVIGGPAVAADIFAEIEPKSEVHFTVRRAAAVRAAAR